MIIVVFCHNDSHLHCLNSSGTNMRWMAAHVRGHEGTGEGGRKRESEADGETGREERGQENARIGRDIQRKTGFSAREKEGVGERWRERVRGRDGER